MTIKWILDERPLEDLGIHFDPAWAWPASSLHVVGEVAARARRSPRRTRLLNMSDSGRSSIEVHDIKAPSAAAEFLYGHLRKDSSDVNEDVGEHASIAFCAIVEPDGVFIADDKQASFLALAELGPGRVATAFDLWAHLRDQGLIGPAQFKALCERTRKSAALAAIPRRFV
ncbi:MAG TPA: hypothetical protein VH083_24730 [Myxococcales bacterium]|jgi:hypothetical protein|nr:hypothetical protein [Myxococcales bacterium]